jgi:hypothetical protein
MGKIPRFVILSHFRKFLWFMLATVSDTFRDKDHFQPNVRIVENRL